MALNKTFVKANGVNTSYHKISSITLEGSDSDTLNLHVKVTSYLNEEYRREGQPVDSLFYNFEITDEQEDSLTIRKLAYAQLKTLDEWADAVDC